MSFAVVWFKDGKFVDGQTVHDPSRARVEMPSDVQMYVLPNDAPKMRREQPKAEFDAAVALMKEARKGF